MWLSANVQGLAVNGRDLHNFKADIAGGSVADWSRKPCFLPFPRGGNRDLNSIYTLIDLRFYSARLKLHPTR